MIRAMSSQKNVESSRAAFSGAGDLGAGGSTCDLTAGALRSRARRAPTRRTLPAAALCSSRQAPTLIGPREADPTVPPRLFFLLSPQTPSAPAPSLRRPYSRATATAPPRGAPLSPRIPSVPAPSLRPPCARTTARAPLRGAPLSLPRVPSSRNASGSGTVRR